MGYTMWQLDGRLAFKTHCEPAAVSAARALWESPGEPPTLSALLSEHGWEHDGGAELEFVGEKFLQDAELFDVLAPFVREGSFIDMRGEDDVAWRWYFDGHALLEFAGVVTFPGCPELCASEPTSGEGEGAHRWWNADDESFCPECGLANVANKDGTDDFVQPPSKCNSCSHQRTEHAASDESLPETKG